MFHVLLCSHFDGEVRECGCLTLSFLLPCDCYCSVALPHGAVGKDKDVDKEKLVRMQRSGIDTIKYTPDPALCIVAHNETDKIGSRAILQKNIFKRYLPTLLYLPSTTHCDAQVS